MCEHFPVPRGFRPALVVDWAHPSDAPPAFLLRPRRYTGRRGQGVRYERKVHEYLAQLAGPAYLPSQWFRFGVAGEARWCQTDGLILDARKGLATILEIKYQHTPDAWFQLRELYEPVVRFCLGNHWDLRLVEVVKWYDPTTFFPERIAMCADPLSPPSGRVGVHIWAP